MISSNCGENAKFAVDLLQDRQIPFKRVLLRQDPLMQYRSIMSMKRVLHKESILISYAPFIPGVNKNLEFTENIPDLSRLERFFELLLGEIPRLRDDQQGYGPQGRNFIDHVNILDQIEEQYNFLRQLYSHYARRS